MLKSIPRRELPVLGVRELTEILEILLQIGDACTPKKPRADRRHYRVTS